MTTAAPPSLLGRVLELLRRCPVKSLGGELLGRVDVDPRGVEGDRLWSVRDPDGKFGSGKSSRRFRRMDGCWPCPRATTGRCRW